MTRTLTWTSGPWDRFPRLASRLCRVRARHAADYHDLIERLLWEDGWYVEREYHVRYDRGNGRIDLVAHKDGISLALELDNRSPRGKSILKLEEVPAGWLVGILLRNPK